MAQRNKQSAGYPHISWSLDFYGSHVIVLNVLLAMLIILAAVGCSTPQRNPVPVDRMEEVSLVGMPAVRAWWKTDEMDPQFQQDLMQSIRDEPSDLFTRTKDGSPQYSGLAISGGGAYGAFGAGVICGWTASGNRPRFKLVTGISTGALIAPYAFLGPAYDAKLKAAYTKVSSKDIYKIKSLLPIGTESLADSAPLADRIARDVDETMLKDIAAAHARGQRLYIGTTNLDAQKFVVWNMGSIAASGHPQALTLFRKIMLASASIPGLLPPVYIEVEANGQTYDEMHVDGGVINQVFFYEFMLDISEARKMIGISSASPGGGRVYVIRNAKIKLEPQHIPRKLLPITQRSVSTMTKAASIKDLLRIEQFAQRDGIEFKFTGIPDDFHFDPKEVFDPEEMNALFEVGYQMGMDKESWLKPPIVID